MRNISASAALIALVLSVASIPLAAQWLDYKTPGIPRLPDGKPNLAAPAPRTPDGKPDLSGMWSLNPGSYGYNVASDLKPGDIQPWAQSLYKQRQEDLGKENPQVLCLPRGPQYSIGGLGGIAKILQTPNLVAILNEDLTYRQIFLDGRQLPKDPNPSFMGYSVGHWEGDTLVVESIGYNDRTWLDDSGHPHTESLRLTERFRRRDFGHVDLNITLEDPKAYAQSWTIAVDVSLVPDTEFLEYVCNENEKDSRHLVGKASDDQKNAVRLPREVLTDYVGVYELKGSELPPILRLVNVTLSGEELMADFGVKNPTQVFALNETTFSGLGAQFQFVKDQGEVTHLIFHMAEGDFRYVRQK